MLNWLENMINKKTVIIQCILIMLSGVICAQDIKLLDVKARSIAGNRSQIFLEFSSQPDIPKHFSLDEPARIIFDFANVVNKLPALKAKQSMSLGVMKDINFINAGNKTRLIVGVLNLVPFNIDAFNSTIVITLDSDINRPYTSLQQQEATISGIDFRRGEAGEGKLIINMGAQKVPIDFKEESSEIQLEFRGASIDDNLLRKYDVTDFGTPVQSIIVKKEQKNILMHIVAAGSYDKIAYQVGEQFIVEVRPD